MRHLLGIEHMSRDEIEHVLETSEAMLEISQREIKRVPTLRGRTVINVFLESSTRTRVSFEIAAKRLSADAINVTRAGSSLSKAETLADMARNLAAMSADVLVVRDSVAGVPHMLAERVRVPVVNAGDGCHEHPTQALLDAFTLRQSLGSLEGRVVAIVGDISHSRVARSDIYCFTKLGAEVRVAAPPTMMPAGIEALGVKPCFSMQEALPGADVVVMLRIQQERLAGALFPSVREYSRHLRPERAHAGAGQAGRDRAAPRADQSRRRDRERHRRRRAVAHPRPGHQRRGRAHGRALPADGRCGVSRLRIANARLLDPASGRDELGSLDVVDGRDRVASAASRRGRAGRGARGERALARARLRRPAHAPARARAGVQGRHRDGHAGRGRRRLHARVLHGEHRSGERQPGGDRVHPAARARVRQRARARDRRGDPGPARRDHVRDGEPRRRRARSRSRTTAR